MAIKTLAAIYVVLWTFCLQPVYAMFIVFRDPL